jgi:hypothetical protein
MHISIYIYIYIYTYVYKVAMFAQTRLRLRSPRQISAGPGLNSRTACHGLPLLPGRLSTSSYFFVLEVVLPALRLRARQLASAPAAPMSPRFSGPTSLTSRRNR